MDEPTIWESKLEQLIQEYHKELMSLDNLKGLTEEQ